MQAGVPLDDLTISKMEEPERSFWTDLFEEANKVTNEMRERGEREPFTPPSSLKEKYEEAIEKYNGAIYCPIKHIQMVFGL